MYAKSSRFYDACYGFKNYDSESLRLREIIGARRPGAATLLDVACGTGQHLERLRHHYQVQGLDLNPEFIEIASARCPQVPFHLASMVDFRIEQRFDIVTCLFSAIGHVKSAENMRRAIASMAAHVSAGGLLLLEPWFTPEQYWVDKVTTNVVKEPGLDISWMYLSRREENLSLLDIHYLVGTSKGVEHFIERLELGLFTREQYLEAFAAAGLPVEWDPQGLCGRGMYIGTRYLN
jgi:SAM-dependent methyltransferase